MPRTDARARSGFSRPPAERAARPRAPKRDHLEPPLAMGISAGVESDRASLAELKDDWRNLAISRGNPFLTPEWFDAWLDETPQASPWVVWVKRADRLVGVLPMVRSGGLLTTPGLIDLFGPASSAADETVVARCAAGLLPARGWSEIRLRNVEADAHWTGVLRSAAGVRLGRTVLRSGRIPWIDMEGSDDWRDYLRARSRSTVRSRSRGAARLERDHSTQYLRTRREGLAEDVATFFRLHDARHSTRSSLRGREGFLERFAASALDRGWLELWRLRVDGADRACKLYFRIGGVLWAYQGGVDAGSEAIAKLSPAGVLQDRIFASAFEEGTRLISLGVGDEEYKMKLAGRIQAVETLSLTRVDRPRHLLVRSQQGARKLYRLLRDRARST